MFGIPRGSRPEDYPIYGYLDPKDGPPGATYHGVGQYGYVRLTLKDQVRNRTTFTVGDSLGTNLAPQPVNKPSLLSVGSYQFDNIDRSSAWATTQKVSYIEAQIHGGVTVRDIAQLDVPADANADTVNRVVNLGRKYNIPVQFYGQAPPSYVHSAEPPAVTDPHRERILKTIEREDLIGRGLLTPGSPEDKRLRLEIMSLP